MFSIPHQRTGIAHMLHFSLGASKQTNLADAGLYQVTTRSSCSADMERERMEDHRIIES